MMTTSRLLALVAGCIATFLVEARASRDAELRPLPAVDLILRAFASYRLVALSDGSGHGQLETADLFAALIRDARFAQTVGNIVVEFGNARYQKVVDRYLAGDVAFPNELRHVWEDTTQVTGVWSLPMYEHMLGDVRAVNQHLPSRLRLRVLLGDPPVDWTTVTSPADEDMNDWRDAHAAHVIKDEVIDRGARALVLYGGAHINRRVVFPNSLIHLLDARFPGQTWVAGILDASRIDPELRARLQQWQLPAGAAVRDSWIGKVDVQRIAFGLSRGIIEDDVDALLLLTLAPPRVQQPVALDVSYERELARRRALAGATLAFRGASIRFEENRSASAATAGEPLHAVVQEMRRDRRLKLLVKAFADSREFDPIALSTERAEAVVKTLVARGVARERLVPRGCGTKRPLTFGTTAGERAMNRRAELVRLTAAAGCEPPW